MKAPKCRICEKEHWPREGCRFTLPEACTDCAVKDAMIRALQAQLDKLESVPLTVTGNTLTIKSNAPLLESNGFDKKAYQREFMRKKRARLKTAT